MRLEEEQIWPSNAAIFQHWEREPNTAFDLAYVLSIPLSAWCLAAPHGFVQLAGLDPRDARHLFDEARRRWNAVIALHTGVANMRHYEMGMENIKLRCGQHINYSPGDGARHPCNENPVTQYRTGTQDSYFEEY
ncbi:hypothetical protein E2C01_046532 [Portunus trituberculatus]|uniref:Uncharacterized protein n=1 Tax=Portunus trituberculatus TaxID=210409 RepID=A0A5B7G542_PORTR|nr:hypothetical protein [Portunus trituberculatus]